MVNYEQNNYLEQNKDFKLFYEEYVGEEMLSPTVTHDKMKTKNIPFK